MPIVKPSAKNIRPDALEIFTDRVAEQEILRKILAPDPPARLGASALLTQIYGVGGVGKSTLCQRACEIAAADFKDTVRVVATSFDDSRWKEGSTFTEVSVELCRCLVGQKIVPRLTLTLLSLHGQQTGRNGEVVGGLDAGWTMAFTAMEKGADLTGIPGLGMMVKGAHWVRERSQRQALRQRLTDLGLWPEEQYGKLNILDLEKKLSSALDHDLLDWLKENPGHHVRLLLDGFERLQSSERREDSQRRLQEFIGFFAGLDEREACDRFRVIMFGRNQLRWDEIYGDSTWRDFWNLHPLEGLAKADALDLLKKTRIWLAFRGQSALAEALVKYEEKILDASDETKGGQRIFFPFYLNLAAELVERARQSGQELELGRAPAELQDRFFRYLEPRELRVLMILALSEVFDEALFDWLAKERLIEYPKHSFHSQLRREHSYFHTVEGREGEWRFHRLMEHALHARWQSTTELKREGVNLIKRVLDYYRASLLAKPERDWTDREAELWRRAMEIIVKQGPELGLLEEQIWKQLLDEPPWDSTHYATLGERIDFCARVLYRQEKERSRDAPYTLHLLNELASLLEDKGDFEQAEAIYHRALAGRERVLGPDHLDTLKTANNLGVLLRGRGDYQGAEALYRRVANEREKILGPDHLDTLRSFNNLGNLLDDRGDSDDAEALFRRALAGFEKAHGPEHPDVLIIINNLGGLLFNKKDFEAAEPLYRRALKGFEKVHGPHHPDTLMCVNNLAEVLMAKDNYLEAESLLRRAVAETEAQLGPDHPLTLTTVSNLGGLLAIRGALGSASELLTKCLAGRVKLLGKHHPDALKTAKDLSRVFRLQYQLDAAAALIYEFYDASEYGRRELRYLLACYECLGNNVEEAKRLIAEEIAGKPAAREQALKDDDLKAIHEFIRLSQSP